MNAMAAFSLIRIQELTVQTARLGRNFSPDRA